METTGISK